MTEYGWETLFSLGYARWWGLDTVSFVPHSAIKPPHANTLLRLGCLSLSVYVPGRFPHRQLALPHLPGLSWTQASPTTMPRQSMALWTKGNIMHWTYCGFQSGLEASVLIWMAENTHSFLIWMSALYLVRSWNRDTRAALLSCIVQGAGEPN